MTQERIAEIKAREAKATPGPYHVNFKEIRSADGVPIAYPADHYLVEDAKANALFIAHARQDVPDLLAEVERLQKRVAELETI